MSHSYSDAFRTALSVNSPALPVYGLHAGCALFSPWRHRRIRAYLIPSGTRFKNAQCGRSGSTIWVGEAIGQSNVLPVKR